jgi:hypothetical protein
MILLCGHIARVHPTTNSPFRRLQVRIRGAHPNFRIARQPPESKQESLSHEFGLLNYSFATIGTSSKIGFGKSRASPPITGRDPRLRTRLWLFGRE